MFFYYHCRFNALSATKSCDIDAVKVFLSISILLTNMPSVMTSDSVPDLCHLPGCREGKLDAVFTEYCHSHNATVEGRCCSITSRHFGTDKAIIGVDLQACNLSTFDILRTNHSVDRPQYNRSLVKIILLDSNPVRHCKNKTFDEMISLEYLLLPDACHCPGGDESWGNTSVSNGSRLCTEQLDLCTTENVTCPKLSQCVMHSPGLTWCSCLSGHYGYKCLRQGKFAMVKFSVVLFTTCALLAAILWTVVRRKVNKVD